MFCWLPSISQKRLTNAYEFLGPFLPHGEWQSIEQIDTEIYSLIEQKDRIVKHHEEKLEELKHLLQQQKICAINWTEALSVFKTKQLPSQVTLSDVDMLADITIRFQIFLLTVHYWEGRWLLEMQELIQSEPGDPYTVGAVQKRWQRYAMLTPCLVTDIYKLPKLLSTQYYKQNTLVHSYLYNFADLLIIDNAQQVRSEIAAASFSLSQKALILGDTKQTLPISMIPQHIDVLNLQNCGLLSQKNTDIDYAYLLQEGKNAYAGNAMCQAQLGCRYHLYPQLDKGFYITENTDSFNDIVAFSNNLCYQNKLHPLRGIKFYAAEAQTGSQDQLPALGYLHISGLCTKTIHNSRTNKLEAQTVAVWLTHHKEKLQALYNKPIEQIVGIITPFNAQAKIIKQACQKELQKISLKSDRLTITTIHNAQGLTFPIILFSSVDSKHLYTDFLDQSPNLLNVAVSCAQNTFLLFGDMDVFELAPQPSPRRELLALLTQERANAIRLDQPLARQDLIKSQNTLVLLQDQQKHKAFLYKILGGQALEIYLAAPGLSIEHLQGTALFHLLTSAVKQGAHVCVYTDLGLDVLSENPFEDLNALRNNLDESIELLQANNIEVHVVKKIYHSVLMRDDNIYCTGNYNWFNIKSPSVAEHNAISYAYFDPGLAQEIEVQNACLQRQKIKQLNKIPL